QINLPKFNEELLRAALGQLAEGLCALHVAGKLHRDIKPSNILVTPERRVVILDFGLVTEFVGPDASQSGDLVGTPTHMSPEQGAGLTISPASDWYSVGVILYEALTGQLPFSGNFFELIMKRQNYDAKAPAEIVNNLPEDLNRLCADLLQ